MRGKCSTLLAVVLSLSLSVAALAGPGVGESSPDFTLNDVYGNAHNLSDYQGKIILLNFWASW